MHQNPNDDRMVMDGNIVLAKFNRREDAAWYLANRERTAATDTSDQDAAWMAQIDALNERHAEAFDRVNAELIAEREAHTQAQARANTHEAAGLELDAALATARSERDLERARADKAEAALAAAKAAKKGSRKVGTQSQPADDSEPAPQRLPDHES